MKNNDKILRILHLLLIFILTILLLNCGKDEVELSETELVFYSLVSEKDTIAPGETTNIVATASGNNLTYYWSASIGDILGSGSKIVYAASPCQTGTNQITCQITNGSRQSKSKTIDIVVYE